MQVMHFVSQTVCLFKEYTLSDIRISNVSTDWLLQPAVRPTVQTWASCACACMGVFVSLTVSFDAHVRVFIHNRVSFQTTISLTALERATKLKPYWAAVCRLPFDLKHALAHMQQGDEAFPLAPPETPSWNSQPDTPSPCSFFPFFLLWPLVGTPHSHQNF